MDGFSTNDFNISRYLFDKLYLNRIAEDFYTKNSYPGVYILYDLNSSKAYVGESTRALSRMTNHLSHPDKKA